MKSLLHPSYLLLLGVLVVSASVPLNAADASDPSTQSNPLTSQFPDTALDDHEEAVSHRQLAQHLHRDFGLRVEDPNDWTISDLRSLAKGAHSLPEAAWRLVDAPIDIEYVDQRCMFSMGRYNEPCPTFGNDERTRFFIYANAPLSGEGPVERLQILTADEQRDIQLRRAVVHLAMIHLDEQFRWSAQRRWRAINGWPRSGSQALNRDTWGYSRYLGMRSSQLDLATFAEEFFVRPEDLLLERADDKDVARRLEAIDPDQTVTCQQFSRRRALNDWMTQIDDNWSEPHRALPQLEDGVDCPAFEQWARPDDLVAFDILLAAATADQPESLFGHLLLHVRYDGGDHVRAQGFEPVYQFGAVTDTDVDPVEYVTRGLLGGFPSILELNTFRGIDRLFLQYQQRDIRRYRLQLTDIQSRRLLERIWESERRIRYPYLFLSDNCASFLLDMLAPALDVPIPEHYGTIVMPTDVLDILADIENGQMGPLLIKRPENLRSNREIAEQSVIQRRALKTALAAELDDDSQYRPLLQELVAELESGQPDIRNRAYDDAQSLFDELLEQHPAVSQQVVDFLYHSVLIERYFTEMSHFARRSVYADTRQESSPQTIEEILQRRRELYANEDIQARLEAINELTLENQQQLAEGPQRELSDSEREVVEYDERTRRAYLTVLQLQSSIIDSHKPNWSGVEYLDGHSEQYRREQQRVDDLSKGPSGRNRITVGGGWQSKAARPDVRLSYSMLEDRLGEIRRRGYRGDLGTRILGVDAQIPTIGSPLYGLQLDLVVLQYASLRRVYGPLQDGLFDRLGWGVDARLTHDGRRDLWASAEVTPSLLIPILTGANKVHHLVAELGLGARYDVYDAQNPLLGATAGLFGQLHLYGSYSNVFRFGAETGQFAGAGPQWRYDIEGRAESRHALFHINQRPLVLVPFVEGIWTTRDYRDDAPPQGFQSWQLGLEVELPL